MCQMYTKLNIFIYIMCFWRYIVSLEPYRWIKNLQGYFLFDSWSWRKKMKILRDFRFVLNATVTLHKHFTKTFCLRKKFTETLQTCLNLPKKHNSTKISSKIHDARLFLYGRKSRKIYTMIQNQSFATFLGFTVISDYSWQLSTDQVIFGKFCWFINVQLQEKLFICKTLFKTIQCITWVMIGVA